MHEPQNHTPLLPGFEPSVPGLIDGMDEEELAITVGLGLVAREAAAVEYVLHGIYVHLAKADKAYTAHAIATGGALIQQCRSVLEQLGDSAVPATSRASLARDLDLAEEHFRLRNRFLHGYWRFDHDVQSWLNLKGAHGMTRPEIAYRTAMQSGSWPTDFKPCMIGLFTGTSLSSANWRRPRTVTTDGHR